MDGDPTPALTGRRRTRPTSPGCRNPQQPEPGRAPLISAKPAVQSNRATSVDEHFVAGGMVLAHHRREAPFELAEQVAKPAVAIPIRVGVSVLLPQHRQIDPGPLQFARERSPIWLDPPAHPRPHAGARKQALL